MWESTVDGRASNTFDNSFAETSSEIVATVREDKRDSASSMKVESFDEFSCAVRKSVTNEADV